MFAAAGLRPPSPSLAALLEQPLPPYQPLPPLSAEQRGRPPRTGELAWLLARELAPHELQQMEVEMLTAGGPVADPGLAQAWDHARRHYGSCPALFAPPGPAQAAPSAAGPVLPVARHNAMLHRLTVTAASVVAQMVGLEPQPAPVAPPVRLLLLCKRAVLRHVFDLPPRRGEAGPEQPPWPGPVARWPPEAVLGHPVADIDRLLRSLDQQITHLLRSPRGGLPSGEDPEPLLECFHRYLQDCSRRLRAMGPSAAGPAP